MKKFIKKIQKGFTLVELIVVMAIIAILAGAGVGTYFGVMNNARKTAANQEATQIKTSIATMFQSATEVKVVDVTYTLTYGNNGLTIANVGEGKNTDDNFRAILVEAFKDDPAVQTLIEKKGDNDKKYIESFNVVKDTKYTIDAFTYQGDGAKVEKFSIVTK